MHMQSNVLLSNTIGLCTLFTKKPWLVLITQTYSATTEMLKLFMKLV